MNKLFLLSIILLACLSCNNKSKEQNNSGFVIDIPDTSKTHFPNISYEIKKKKVEELNLNKLENGADSFELRLWKSHAMINLGDLFVIKKINNEWSCIYYWYSYNKNEIHNSTTLISYVTNFSVDSFRVFKLKPKSGWNSFFRKIEEYKIYELPDQKSINGWEIKHGDGLSFSIEFATLEKYKFYTYLCPDLYEDEFIENKFMSNILEVFNQEFGLGGTFRNKCK